MQFLPTDITSFFTTLDKDALPQAMNAAGENSPQALEAPAGGEENPAAEFQRLFREAVAAVNGGEEVSATAALRDSAGPLARGPYSRHTTDGVTYSLDEVCFTKKELLELRREILKAGAPEQALRHFDALAGQPDGATLAQVMASLQQMTVPRQLDKKDKDNIAGLLGRIDPTGDLAQEAVSLMEEGRGQAALTLISQTFSSAGDGGVEMRKDELLSLGKGLGLDTETLRRIAGAMGDYAAGLFSSAQFNALTAPAQERFAAENARQGKVNEALEATLKPVIARARARMEKEKAASSLQERKVEQSRTHIEKTVLRNSRRRLDIVLREGQSGHDDADPAGAAHSDAVVKRSATNGSDAVSAEVADKTAPRDRGVKSAAAAPAAERTGMPLAGSGGKNSPSGPRSRDIVSARLYHDAPPINGAQAPQAVPQTPPTQTWLADRLIAQDMRPATAAPPANAPKTGETGSDGRPADDKPDNQRQSGGSLTEKQNLTTARAEGGTGPQPAAAAHAPVFETLQTLKGEPPAVSRHAADQVRESLYAALRNEFPRTARLDLQLHPQELGAISIALTLHNGEVHARIRPEKDETAELLSRQAEIIRTNLEQQGVKVDRIEVLFHDPSNNDGGDNGGPRQNPDQTGARQEKDSLRDDLARLRALANIRNSFMNPDNEILEQPVHYHKETARYADQALHLVA
jgi:flagellar hook-length control protein FliK